MEEKRVVDKLIDSIEKQLLKQTKKIQETAHEEEKQIEEIKTKLNILKKYQVKFPMTDAEKAEVSTLLCFNNLGYCCKKECPWRNAVLDICDISTEYFEKVKENLGMALMTPSTIIGTKKTISEEDIVEVNRKI